MTTKNGQISDYEVHPLALEYPVIGGAEYHAMVQSMKDHGFNRMHPIILYEGMILDGRSRHMASQEAGVEAVYVELIDEDPEQFVRDANEHRRHLTQEWLIKQREKRVAEKRRHGKSTRQIAEEEKISHTQVVRDINNQAERDVPPANGAIPIDPPNVVGRDGKSYSARPKSRKPKKVGSVVYDDRIISELVGKLARAINDRGKAVGKTDGHQKTVDCHEQTIRAWKEWQKEKA